MVEEEEGRQGALAGALDAGDKGGDGGPSQAICWGRAGAPSEKYPHDGMGADRLPTSPQPATSTQAASLRPYCAQGRARGETQWWWGAKTPPNRVLLPLGAPLSGFTPGPEPSNSRVFLCTF